MYECHTVSQAVSWFISGSRRQWRSPISLQNYNYHVSASLLPQYSVGGIPQLQTLFQPESVHACAPCQTSVCLNAGCTLTSWHCPMSWCNSVYGLPDLRKCFYGEDRFSSEILPVKRDLCLFLKNVCFQYFLLHTENFTDFLSVMKLVLLNSDTSSKKSFCLHVLYVTVTSSMRGYSGRFAYIKLFTHMQ